MTVGLVHAGLMNPWSEKKIKEVGEKLSQIAKDGWKLVAAIPAGNNDRGIYIFER